jgi:DNA-binding CsgD family transcriptional regulator
VELVLTDREQSSVRRLLLAEPEPGFDLLPRAALDAVVRLFPCDMVSSAELDAAATGPWFGGAPVRGHGTLRIALRTSSGTVAQICLARRRGQFSGRDEALLAMLAPALGRLILNRPRLTGGSALSGAEQRVLELVACGRSNQEVADDLCITVATVRKHLEHTYRKLGVTSRTAAVAALQDASSVS